MDGHNKAPLTRPAGVLDPTDLTHTPPPPGEMANASSELHAPEYTSPVSLPAPEPSPGYSHGYGYTPTPTPSEVQRSNRSSVITFFVIALGVIVVLGAAAVVAVFAPNSSIFGTSAGPVVTQPVAIPLGGAAAASASLNMGAGNMNVKVLPAGSANVVDGSVYYDVPQWKPEVNYNVSGDTGRLTVSQPDVQLQDLKSKRYDWNLSLNRDVPVVLRAVNGAGNIDLQLSGMNLSSLTVGNGAGNTTVNLEGNWPKSFDAKLTTGAGKTTLRLPSDVGVQVTVQNGLGQVTANGLTVNGNVYTNKAYGSSPVTLKIDVSTGVGETRLEVGK